MTMIGFLQEISHQRKKKF